MGELARMIYDEPAVIEDVGGVKVEIKPVPDDDRPGIMDSREFYVRKVLYELQKKYPAAAPSVETVRKTTQTYCKPVTDREIQEKRFAINVDGREVPVFCYDGSADNKAAAVIYIHGGSFFAGRAESYRIPCQYIADKAECVVFNIDYSLAPENPYPAAIEECTALLRYIYDRHEEFGIDRNKIVLSGDSAGGNLAVAVAMSCSEDIWIRRLELFYPVVDLYAEDGLYEWNEDKYEIAEEQRDVIESRLVLGRLDAKGNPALMGMIVMSYLGDRHDMLRKNPLVSMIYGDLENLPPCTLYSAEFDGLRIQDEYFAQRYRQSGNECRLIRYKGVSHAFLDYTGVIPQAEASLLELVRELEEL